MKKVRLGIIGIGNIGAVMRTSWIERTVEIPFDEDLFLAELDKRRRKQ